MDPELERDYGRRLERPEVPAPPEPDSTQRLLVQVFQETTLPTAAGHFFACHPVELSGTEAEGGTPTVTVSDDVIYVDVLGPGVPHAGDILLATARAWRWTAHAGTAIAQVCGGIIVYVKGCLGITSPFGSNGLIGASVSSGTGGAITGVVLDTGGAGYSSTPSCAPGTDGVGGIITVTMTGSVTAATVGGGGQGYLTAPVVTIAPPTLPGGVQATATAHLTGAGSLKTVSSVTIDLGGSGYSVNPGMTIAPPPPAVHAAGTAVLDGAGGVASVTLTDAGTVYVFAPVVSFSGGGGTGATATCTVTNGSLNTPTITHAGTGYTSVPTVFIGAPGSAFAASGTTSRGNSLSVDSLAISAGGVGYTLAPLTFSGGGGTGAAAHVSSLSPLTILGTCTTKGKAVAGINPILTFGSGYTNGQYPVTFTGGGGTGAAATFVVTGGIVAHVFLTDGGHDYTSIPVLSFPGAGGTGAAATCTIGNACVIPYTTGGNYWIKGACTGLDTKTVNNTIVCNNNTQVQVAPTVTTGYHCVQGVCNRPFPDAAFITDSNGSHAMTFSTLLSGVWWGCYSGPGGTPVKYLIHSTTGVLDITWTTWNYNNSDLGHPCNIPGGEPCPGSCPTVATGNPTTEYPGFHGPCRNNPTEQGLAQGIATQSFSPTSSACNDCGSAPSITYTLPTTYTAAGHTFSLPVSGTVTFTP